jgi:methylated-DNA-[protein]-cysteine S-methyltransferase
VSTRVVTYEIDGWGVGELALVDGRPVHHELPWPSRRVGSDHLPARPGGGADGPAERLVARIRRFFAWRPVVWTAEEIGLAQSCEEWGLGPFATRLAHALCAVGWGERVAYGELAERAGSPRAARAAGTFCAHNRLALMLPCHRVVSSDGSLGGYGAHGTAYKARLLALEGRG